MWKGYNVWFGRTEAEVQAFSQTFGAGYEAAKDEYGFAASLVHTSLGHHW